MTTPKTKVCERCGEVFAQPKNQRGQTWGKRRFCSPGCSDAGRTKPTSHKRRPIAERFWPKVDVRGPEECWEWQGTREGAEGYGILFKERQANGNPTTLKAHRLSYELNIGPIPDGLWVLHHCDNRPCVNPAHLYAGTARDNAIDRETRRRGRPQDGGVNANAKLTAKQVDEIRSRYAAGGVTQDELAKEYAVIQPHISRIVRGETWKQG